MKSENGDLHFVVTYDKLYRLFYFVGLILDLFQTCSFQDLDTQYKPIKRYGNAYVRMMYMKQKYMT